MISISRHRTAIKRTNYSRPIRLALEDGIINENTSVFDYGCGHGNDIRLLENKGIYCNGWDPIYRPNNPREQSDIVNLGYVINVIENPAERADALREAWSLAKKALIVSARLNIEIKDIGQTLYEDGYLTRIGTFQKFYDQKELRDWIDSILGTSSISAAPGIFYVFRDQGLGQSFVASRYRRHLVAPRQKIGHEAFERHKPLFESLMNFISSRGRLPDETELEEAKIIREQIGSLQRAFAIIRHVTGPEQWNNIQTERSNDLLIYLALARFGGRPRFSELPFEMQLDIRAFFSTYTRACGLADELLFSAGKPDLIQEACRKSPVGKLTSDALYIHKSALIYLPPVLRVYEGCAHAYIGAVEGANVIKLSRIKPQVSYLYYPEFERAPHPALSASLVVPLRSFHVQYRDYTGSANPFILHRKEEFLPPDHPLRPKLARLTKQEERYRLFEKSELIGTREGWERELKEKNVRLSGHRIVRRNKDV